MTKTDDEIIEVPPNTDLFKLVKPENTVIHRGNDYWMYEVDFEGCEECGKEITRRGWTNVTHIVEKAFILKQKQQDELLNKFNKKVDEYINEHIKNAETHDYHEGYTKEMLVSELQEFREKSKQLAKEIFTKTKEE